MVVCVYVHGHPHFFWGRRGWVFGGSGLLFFFRAIVRGKIIVSRGNHVSSKILNHGLGSSCGIRQGWLGVTKF